MKYNFNFFIKEVFTNVIKYGKVKINYFRLKKIIKKIFFLLKKNFNNKIKVYLIKIKYKKGDCSLLGEFGIKNFLHFKNITHEK
ncbi:hypothetical protein ACJEC8_00375 [Candidatus Carsonella ruddii]|uniref:hypothetical protein n=1 Tax=Carsonella ruddii TaxID=114186 RepID=UPI003D3C283A